MAFWIVFFLRLIVPLTILRWPLVGGIVSLVLDALDVVIGEALASLIGYPKGVTFNYHSLDKLLDLYYLSLEFWVVLGWKNLLAKRTAIVLFVYRALGVLSFWLTGKQQWLFYFPNLFENWYLYYLLAVRFFPRFVPTNIFQLLFVLLILFIPKYFQEWLLHYQLAHPWSWIKSKLLP